MSPPADPEALEPQGPARDSATRWAPVLKALGDRTRLHVALLLAERPRTVKELQEATGVGQALLSHHLRPLREQGLIQATPSGRSNVYRLRPEPLAGLTQCLAAIVAAAQPTGAAAE